MVYRPTTHGILTPLPMVFWSPTHGTSTPYPWYFDPLSMVFWPPAYLLIRNEGGQNTMGVQFTIQGGQYTMGQNTIWHRSFLHSWPITGFVIRLTWRVPLVEQEQLTFLEHPSSVPVFSYTIFSFMCMLCRSLFVLLSFFVIVFSVLRFTDSYYPFRLWYLETLLKKSCYSFPNRLLC